jgi:hypothetical protein
MDTYGYGPVCNYYTILHNSSMQALGGEGKRVVFRFRNVCGQAPQFCERTFERSLKATDATTSHLSENHSCFFLTVTKIVIYKGGNVEG